jgi:uncharacterized membrane protein
MTDSFLKHYLNDVLALAVSAAVLAAYHLYLRIQIRRDPHYTVQAVHSEARTAWVESVMKDRRDLLAVQTLRNSTMAATFLASTAVLLIVGTLSLSSHGGDVENALHALNIAGAVDPSLWLIKLILLILDLCVAFFSFTLAIRTFNHVGYLLNVPPSFDHPVMNTRYVAALLNRAAAHYSVGMRSYYFTLPLLFWLFSPYLMIACSVALVFVLYWLDRAQDAGD